MFSVYSFEVFSPTQRHHNDMRLLLYNHTWLLFC